MRPNPPINMNTINSPIAWSIPKFLLLAADLNSLINIFIRESSFISLVTIFNELSRHESIIINNSKYPINHTLGPEIPQSGHFSITILYNADFNARTRETTER